MEERKSRYELFLEDEARKAQPTKRCSKCGETKALGEFGKDSSAKTGVMSQCKFCVNSRRRKFKNREDRFWKSFWSQTKKVGDCLEWQGACCGRGRIPSCKWHGKMVHVRRVVYMLSMGWLADDAVMLSSCNNLLCVKHSHIIPGTKEDRLIRFLNIDHTGDRNGTHTHPERVSRGENHIFRKHPERHARGDRSGSRLYPERVARGEGHHKAKLSDATVRSIRDMFSKGNISRKEIARRLGVGRSAVSRVISGKTWAHVQ